MIWRRFFLLSYLAALLVLVLARTVVAGPSPVVGEGVIRSEERLAVKAKVLSPINQIAVKEGEVVRRGDLLIAMDNKVHRAHMEVAKAEAERVRAALAEAELTLEITLRELERNLKVPDLITEKELELSRDAVRKAKATLRTMQAELSRAEALFHVAEAAYAETFIRAPFDAIVSRIHVHVGDTAKVAETVLLDLLSLERLYVEVALPLPAVRQVRRNMVAQLEVEGEHPSIKISLVGTVAYVYPEVDSTTRMFRAKVRVPHKGFLVLPGMFTKVVIDPSQ
jgi:RND family efflux transporter MFP subunit